MAKKDIFKIDNYFIRIGIIFLIIGLVATFTDPRTYNDVQVVRNNSHYSFEKYQGRTLEEIQSALGADMEVNILRTPVVRPIIAASGLCLLIIGIVFRKKEKKIISIWDALEKTGEGKVLEMAAALRLSREFILENLKHINVQQGSYYVYQPDKDIIVDGRLLEKHAVTLNCSGCGNNINKEVTLANLDGLSCSYCGSPVQVKELLKIRGKILEESRAEQLSGKEGYFSIAIFIALLIFFWPAAIVYLLIKKGGAAKKSVEAMRQFSKENLAGSK